MLSAFADFNTDEATDPGCIQKPPIFDPDELNLKTPDSPQAADSVEEGAVGGVERPLTMREHYSALKPFVVCMGRALC